MSGETMADEISAKRAASKVPLCEVYLMCLNPATGKLKNPILGDVPTCDDHKE